MPVHVAEQRLRERDPRLHAGSELRNRELRAQRSIVAERASSVSTADPHVTRISTLSKRRQQSVWLGHTLDGAQSGRGLADLARTGEHLKEAPGLVQSSDKKVF
jgi:hypothetical protein